MFKASEEKNVMLSTLFKAPTDNVMQSILIPNVVLLLSFHVPGKFRLPYSFLKFKMVVFKILCFSDSQQILWYPVGS